MSDSEDEWIMYGLNASIIEQNESIEEFEKDILVDEKKEMIYDIARNKNCKRTNKCWICKNGICKDCSYKHPKYGMICYEHPLRKPNKIDNISKKVSQHKHSDRRKWRVAGDISEEYIRELLEKQNNRCYICKDEVLLDYLSGCWYQFSIDRLNSNLPHDKYNCVIACYYCNCRKSYANRGKESFKVCPGGCHNVKRILPTRWEVLKTILPEYGCYMW